jgi:hypothetical protein
MKEDVPSKLNLAYRLGSACSKYFPLGQKSSEVFPDFEPIGSWNNVFTYIHISELARGKMQDIISRFGTCS